MHMNFNRRQWLLLAGVAAASAALSPMTRAATDRGDTILDFEEKLFRARDQKYRHPEVDIINQGFRPVGGSVADFAVGEHAGRVHFYYIERRLQEGTPFYPGHEIFFGHASTANFFDWEVHDPVLLVRPGTWEEAHVWAPSIGKRGDEYIMAYTGLNRHVSQDIGLASSHDMFEWKRWESNPISPCKDKDWAAWWPDKISSCRDPNLFEHEGRWYINYTANTKEGATCIALCSTTDFKTWKDHGPICIGPAGGYEMRLEGGHPQGSFESANMIYRNNKWYLTLKGKIRDTKEVNWIMESDSIDRFDFAERREFWPEGYGIEFVRHDGSRTLMATFCGGYLRFGTVDWADPKPVGRLVTAEELRAWQKK